MVDDSVVNALSHGSGRPAAAPACVLGGAALAVALWCLPNVADRTARLTLQVRLQRIRSACSGTT